MKALFPLVLLLTSMVLAQADWTNNYPAALAQASAQNKLVLLDFTGSDWCPYCQLLHKEVLTTPAFQSFADTNYVLVRVDFPHQKQLPDEVRQQNRNLQQQFNVYTFPTLIVVNAEGKGLGRKVGYNPGSGPGPVIAMLTRINHR